MLFYCVFIRSSFICTLVFVTIHSRLRPCLESILSRCGSLQTGIDMDLYVFTLGVLEHPPLLVTPLLLDSRRHRRGFRRPLRSWGYFHHWQSFHYSSSRCGSCYFCYSPNWTRHGPKGRGPSIGFSCEDCSSASNAAPPDVRSTAVLRPGGTMSWFRCLHVVCHHGS